MTLGFPTTVSFFNQFGLFDFSGFQVLDGELPLVLAHVGAVALPLGFNGFDKPAAVLSHGGAPVAVAHLTLWLCKVAKVLIGLGQFGEANCFNYLR